MTTLYWLVTQALYEYETEYEIKISDKVIKLETGSTLLASILSQSWLQFRWCCHCQLHARRLINGIELYHTACQAKILCNILMKLWE